MRYSLQREAEENVARARALRARAGDACVAACELSDKIDALKVRVADTVLGIVSDPENYVRQEPYQRPKTK